MFRAFFSSLLVAFLPGCALAQANPDSIKHRNNCRLAAQVLETGYPSPRYEWALEQAWRCPEAAPGLAAEMKRWRTTRDTTLLNALTQPTIELRDGRIFETAMEIAGDEQATTEARIFAIRTLIYAMRPGGGISYRNLAERGEYCYGFNPSQHQIITRGTALTGDYVQRVNALGLRLAGDSSEPDAIRHAGMCAGLAREAIYGR